MGAAGDLAIIGQDRGLWGWGSRASGWIRYPQQSRVLLDNSSSVALVKGVIGEKVVMRFEIMLVMMLAELLVEIKKDLK